MVAEMVKSAEAGDGTAQMCVALYLPLVARSQTLSLFPLPLSWKGKPVCSAKTTASIH